MIKLSKKEARRLYINAQGLNRSFGNSLQVIEALGYVQIDTIAVVERAHHHVFWSRYPKYKNSDLEQILSERKVFEYWAHAASYLPMRDYRYSLYRKMINRKRQEGWWDRDKKLMSKVLKRIEKEGPLASRDFKTEGSSKGNGWWDWKPTKRALEQLFLDGRLEVSRRDGFQKVYDLPEKVIPSQVNTVLPSDKEYARYIVERTLAHHSLAKAGEISYLGRGPIKKLIKNYLGEQCEEGELQKVQVEGVDEVYYASHDLDVHNKRLANKLHILSPFDNSVIQRQKLRDLFGFEYQIECYLPEEKREYGYFTLPILLGDQFIARADCKAHRKEGVFELKSLHYESGVKKGLLKPKVMKKLNEFALFNDCSLK